MLLKINLAHLAVMHYETTMSGGGQGDTQKAQGWSKSIDPTGRYLVWESCLHGTLLEGTFEYNTIEWVRQHVPHCSYAPTD